MVGLGRRSYGGWAGRRSYGGSQAGEEELLLLTFSMSIHRLLILQNLQNSCMTWGYLHRVRGYHRD